MHYEIADIKGVHPGLIVERELKRRNIGKGRFAISINEFPQTLGSITKGKRKMNTELSLKIERELDLDEGFLMTLQVYYDIQEVKRSNSEKPNLALIRKSLFWDTSIGSINWQDQKSSVIKRVLERGNGIEKNEIARFYGLEKLSL